jgi:hypothetical protein
MSSFMSVQNATMVSAVGMRLTTMADELKTQITAVKDEIATIEAERPWGNDHFGEGFEATYLRSTDGELTLREAVLDGMEVSGGTLREIGDTTVLAMTRYQGGEAQNAAEIRSTGLDA